MASLTSHSPTAAIVTLGCKLNIADSEAMALQLRRAGWRVTGQPGGADAVIVNSCSVTSTADQKSRHAVRRARRLAPGASVFLTGCMVETAPAESLASLPVDGVYRQPQQSELAGRVAALHPSRVAPATLPARLKTRAFVAAQEGCNDVCAFCIIPRTRGRERSKSIEEVVAEAREREAEGIQELVITGTQLGAYGRDSGTAGLYPLLSALLESTSFPRIRISSVQPQDLSEAMIGLWQDPRLCRHFHLALQSGSDPVLRRMRRRYTTAEYAGAVELLRQKIPDVAITTDVIAGFPGETDEEFEQCLEFCRRVGFSAVHVFPYSQRGGTSAEKLSGQVREDVKKQRVQELIAVGQESAAAYRSGLLGRRVPVLWERRRDTDIWEGLTDTYNRVETRYDGELHNRITESVLLETRGDVFWTEVNPP